MNNGLLFNNIKKSKYRWIKQTFGNSTINITHAPLLFIPSMRFDSSSRIFIEVPPITMSAFEGLWGIASYTHNEKFNWKVYTYNYSAQSWKLLSVVRPLTTASHHDAGHAATDGAVGCQGENRCHQPQQSRHRQCYHGISRSSVTLFI